jgi:hypothetical protein
MALDTNPESIFQYSLTNECGPWHSPNFVDTLIQGHCPTSIAFFLQAIWEDGKHSFEDRFTFQFESIAYPFFSRQRLIFYKSFNAVNVQALKSNDAHLFG